VSEPEASLRRLRRLRRIYHVSFVCTVAAAVGHCGAADSARGPIRAGLVAAIAVSFLVGFVAQALVWRTRCPSCGQPFFSRSWSLERTWAGFPTDENCGRCRFNLYRATDVRGKP